MNSHIYILKLLLLLYIILGFSSCIHKTLSVETYNKEVDRKKSIFNKEIKLKLLSNTSLEVYEKITKGSLVSYDRIKDKTLARGTWYEIALDIFIVRPLLPLIFILTSPKEGATKEQKEKRNKEVAYFFKNCFFYLGLDSTSVVSHRYTKIDELKEKEDICTEKKLIKNGFVNVNIHNHYNKKIPIIDGIAMLEIGDFPLPEKKIINNVHLKFSYKDKTITSKVPKELYLSALKKRGVPCELSINVEYTDEKSHTPNDAIEPFEKSYAKITISNNGKGMAFGVNIIAEATKNDINIPKSTKVDNISPQSSKIVMIPIKAGAEISTGNIQIKFFCKEERGYGSKTEVVEIKTNSLKPPSLEILSFRIVDSNIGFSKGNNNGLIENGETIELEFFVKNNGSGDAKKVKLFSKLQQKKIEIKKQSAILGDIFPGQTVTGKLLFTIHRDFNENKFLPQIIVNDQFNISATKKIFNIPVRYQTPVFKYNATIIAEDEGIINNGDTVFIDFTIKNISDLDAKNVKIDLSILEKGPKIIGHESVHLSDIQKHSGIAVRRVKISIPRNYSNSKLTLKVLVTQNDFDTFEFLSVVNIKYIEPQLVISILEQSGIINNTMTIGKVSRLKAIIENRGELSANNVFMNLKSLNPNIFPHFLDGKSEKELKSLPAYSKVVEEFLILAKKNEDVELGLHEIKIELSQSEFSPFKTKYSFATTDNISFGKIAEKNKQPSQTFFDYNHPPIIWISYPDDNTTVNKNTITLQGYIDDDKGISKVEIKLNGKLISQSSTKGIQISEPLHNKKQSQKRYVFSPELFLNKDKNIIEIIAWDSDNLEAAKKLIVKKAKKKSIIWVAVIGINNYKSPKIPDLKYAVSDAKIIAKYFEQQMGLNQSNIIELFDEDATRNNVEKLLGDYLPRKTRINDTVIIFYSGHGAPESNLGNDKVSKYLLTSDTDPEHMWSTALPMDRVGKIFDRISSERIVFLADTCYSGATNGLTDGKTLQLNFKNISSNAFLEKIFSGKGRVIITASGPNELAREDSKLGTGHGVFTYFLEKALNGYADMDKDNFITTDEAYSYIHKNVSHYTNNLQNPVMISRSEKPIIIGTKTGNLIQSNNTNVVVNRTMQNQLFESKSAKNQCNFLEIENTLLNILKKWKNSWSLMDLTKYLSFYSKEFKLPKNIVSRKSWEKLRANRLKKKYIKIHISEPKFKSITCNIAQITFIQSYETEGYKESSLKTLIFKKYDTNWQIIEEIQHN